MITCCDEASRRALGGQPLPRRSRVICGPPSARRHPCGCGARTRLATDRTYHNPRVAHIATISPVGVMMQLWPMRSRPSSPAPGCCSTSRPRGFSRATWTGSLELPRFSGQLRAWVSCHFLVAPLEGHRGLLTETLVTTMRVIPSLDELEDSSARLVMVVEVRAVEPLAFEGGEEALRPWRCRSTPRPSPSTGPRPIAGSARRRRRRWTGSPGRSHVCQVADVLVRTR